MRPDYNGVKYYGPNDLSLGLYYEKAKEILESLDTNKEYTDINEVLELYNVNKLFLSPGIKAEYAAPYKVKANGLMEPIARFFNSIDDNNLLFYFHCVCFNYIEDFWELYDKLKIYNKTSDIEFERLLNEPEASLFLILRYKGVVIHFDITIANYMRQSDQTARIIVEKFLEKKAASTKESIYFPSSLKANEFEQILDKYIDSDDSNVGVIQLIASSQSSSACPISDLLRLKARRKAKEYWDNHASEGIRVSYGVGVCFKRNSELMTLEIVEPNEYLITYDIDWIKDNLDYPTLLNNFIYLFEYVDPCFRCSFASIDSKLGITEKLFGIKGIKEYEIGTAFRFIDIKSTEEMKGYASILSENNIRIEDLIQWFFKEYLKEEFQVDGFVVNMPSSGSTTLEKCRVIPAEMDGIFKQYKMFANNHAIDRELLEMSSNPVRFCDLPSMIERKYAYANSDSIRREEFLLFSNQSMLNYIPKHRGARSFYDLLNKDSIKLSDYPKQEIPVLRWLESRDDIEIGVDGTIRMNTARVRLLKDLYDHDVICISYYRNTDIIDQLLKSGDVRVDSTLFSIPEQNYLNYILNKSEYSNGLDLRNKYIHSTYPTDEEQQEEDYLRLLKVLIMSIIKINEEFCLANL